MKRLLAFILCLFVFSGCSTGESISMGGSSSVHPLADMFIEEYCAEYPGTTITYDGPGSSKGVEGIKTDIYQFGFLSREVKDSEKDDQMEIKTIANDGITVVVNPNNPVEDLTMEQIKGIFEGSITNWSEVGGNDEAISIVARDSASGTRSAFDEIVGVENLAESALQYDSNGAVAQAVEKNPASIGYISFATYAENSSVVKGVNVEGAAPTAENVSAGTYKLYRPFVMVYYPEKLTEKSKEFLTWLEENSSRIVEEAGFLPVSEGGNSSNS